ncbi:MAG: hypothetical protein ACI8RZ_002939 [Myxococcota bacterium]|jgi:hypothetical protein
MPWIGWGRLIVMLTLAPYLQQNAAWPTSGRHILAQHDEETVIVYQAYNKAIADWAVSHQQLGGPWSFGRMSWIKPNFLWMMYRSGWAGKPNQERILALRITREGFDTILSQVVESSYHSEVDGPDRDAWRARGKVAPVRMQWDPDHAPGGSKEERRAIQLGLRGETLRRFAVEWTREIADITPLVRQQHDHRQSGEHKHLMTPAERVYVPEDAAICTRIRLTLP